MKILKEPIHIFSDDPDENKSKMFEDALKQRKDSKRNNINELTLITKHPYDNLAEYLENKYNIQVISIMLLKAPVYIQVGGVEHKIVTMDDLNELKKP